MSDLGTLSLNKSREHARATSLDWTPRGTITANKSREHARATALNYQTRPTGPLHERARARGIPAQPPEYASDRAHYPVRINGREHAMTCPAPSTFGWPFTAGGQQWSDTFGRIIYHPHTLRLLWSVDAGSRSITINMRHHAPAESLPTITLRPAIGMGISDLSETVPEEQDTPHQITINVTPTTAGIITIELTTTSHALDATATWGDVATT